MLIGHLKQNINIEKIPALPEPIVKLSRDVYRLLNVDMSQVCQMCRSVSAHLSLCDEINSSLPDQ